MGVPQVDSCCGCCPTRTGALIIGWLMTVFGGLVFLGGIVAGTGAPSPVIGLIVGVLILYGTYNRRPGFLIPYLVLQIIGLVFAFLLFVALLFVSDSFIDDMARNSNIDPKVLKDFKIGFEFALLIGAALNVYFTLVVNSHRKELEEDGGRGRSMA